MSFPVPPVSVLVDPLLDDDIPVLGAISCG
jgi:hypothetical protein